MNSKELYQLYKKNKTKFHDYIDSIKKNSEWDIYTIINSTLIKNPYASKFPKKFFLGEVDKKNNIIFFVFIKSSFKFYLKQLIYFFLYFVSFVLFKIYYKKNKVERNCTILIDIFLLIDNINKDKKFNENYFIELYKVLDKYNKNYTILPRLYGINKNPFKLIKFLKIINQEKKEFLFEFDLLSLSDFIYLFLIILVYPFKTLRLLQKEKNNVDALFNNELIKDIGSIDFNSFSRYITGKNISNLKNIKIIYSWSEFQVIERSFNYGIRTQNNYIKIIACQFFLNYETYFNAYVDDLDYDMLSSPHKVLVNGKYYVLDRKKVIYGIGVSLRYKDIFSFKAIKEEKNILLLGSYIEKDTKYMLYNMGVFSNVIFKNHPAVNIKNIGKLPDNVALSSENIYKLFENTKLVIGTASGTAVEAVACGVSVIIIASEENLTANPLVEYGKGKIWDIVFDVTEMESVYNKLIDYRMNNLEEIKEIACWYKDNFFVEPIENSIIKVFELK